MSGPSLSIHLWNTHQGAKAGYVQGSREGSGYRNFSSERRLFLGAGRGTALGLFGLQQTSEMEVQDVHGIV